ncbi:hypothetical protein D3C80_1791120 [compost metagenome]
MASLLGCNARISAFRVDKGNDRSFELVRLMHKPERFTEALGVCTAEETCNVILRIFTPLLSKHSNRHTVQLGQSANYGQIVSEHPITVELNKIFKNQRNKIK